VIVRLSILFVVIAQGASAQSLPEARTAVTRALPLLQRSAATFVAQRACVSCHHNSLAILTLRLARQRRFDVDSKTLDAVEAKTFRELRSANALDDAVQAANVSDPTPNDSYLLLAARAAGVPRDLTTGVYARRIARWQRDGHWITSDFRPPHSSSLFTATATAVRAMHFYLPEELSAERDAAIRRARDWLVATGTQSTEDAAFRLLAPDADKVRLLIERGANVKRRSASKTDVLAIAASHYGSSASIRALLEAGADAHPPERVRRAALEYASMSGDLDAVGDPACPWRRGLTWGTLRSCHLWSRPDVVQALVDAGVHVQVTESSGINLLHWAVITNRASVIPVLVRAGVPVNATDDFRFTPLMYAATVDVGNGRR
jgi:Ankyrin repeats (3 copies)